MTKAPKPDKSHAPITGQTILFPYIEQSYLTRLNNSCPPLSPAFPSQEIRHLAVGDIIYVPYGHTHKKDADKDAETEEKTKENTKENEEELEEGETDEDETTGCYLAEIIFIGEKARIHFPDSTMMTNMTDSQIFDDIPLLDRVFLARKKESTTDTKPSKEKATSKAKQAEEKKAHAERQERIEKQKEEKLNEILENTKQILAKATKNEQQKPPQHPQPLQQPPQPLQQPPQQPPPHLYHALQLHQHLLQQPTLYQQLPQQPVQLPRHQPRPADQPKPRQDPRKQLGIRNVPNKKDEDLNEIILSIAETKNMRITKTDFTCLRAISALKDNNMKKTPPNIIISFHKTENKIAFKKLTDTDLTINKIIKDETNTTPIYIEENLPPNTRELFWKTRLFKTKHSWAYAWAKNGIIYLRKDSGESTYIVDTTAKLDSITHDAAALADKCANASTHKSSSSSSSSSSSGSSKNSNNSPAHEKNTTKHHHKLPQN